MENLPGPTPKERRQILILTLVSMGVTFILVLWPQVMTPDLAVNPGKATISVREDDQGRLWASEIIETGPISPSKVRINNASREFLLACPGIGPVLANAILQERLGGRFRSWDDLQERVSGLGPAKIEVLKGAGVELDP